MDSVPSRLPQTFLRGLEADLRSLSVDARRRNPSVKEAAERVILLLKEADSPSGEIAAADEAATAFCAACEPLDTNQGSTALAVQVKVALRAVSCLHKLLTHRAVSPKTLGQILHALQQLARPSVDDNLTVKVLQGLLSLLTVRAYAQALAEEELSRAFSLLFVLRSKGGNMGGAVVGPLSAISQMGAGSEDGVIEQTSKAAFRQVSSDLFAAAADAAVRTAVQKQVPSGERIELSEFPSETRAAFSLFMDLCSAANGDELIWVSSAGERLQGLDVGLALEVLDDALASNLVLFGGHEVFVEKLSERLCPVLHRLLRTCEDKAGLKSLLGLVVTLVRGYWRILKPDSEALLYALAKMASGEKDRWGTVFAMEALRCIFKTGPGEVSMLVEFVQTFDLSGSSGKLTAGVISAACDTMNLVDGAELGQLPPTPVNGNMKPFANIIANSLEFLVAIASGLYLQVIKAASDASRAGLKPVAVTLLSTDVTERVVKIMGKMMDSFPPIADASTSRLEKEAKLGALKALAEGLGLVAITASECELESVREKALVTLAAASKGAVRHCLTQTATGSVQSKRVEILFEVLFGVQEKCRENLRRSWVPVVEALEQFDFLVLRIEADGEVEGRGFTSLVDLLKPKLGLVFTSTALLKWSACHDLISALVQCSRQTIAIISKRASAEESQNLDDRYPRVFGISGAETAILHAFQRELIASDTIPATLWQLLTGHLTSVCTDSALLPLRQLALRSLTRIACGAISSGHSSFVEHDKIITPFLDLFTASHVDIRSGSLSAIHTILETQGERLRGELAWTAVLKVLSTAAGSANAPTLNGFEREQGQMEGLGTASPAAPSGVVGTDMMSEAFKVVQVISDDFLTSLVESALPAWIEVLSLYSRQEEDVNVALTSIGLLWRTADFFAKTSGLKDEDQLWVQLFEVLKEISMDERPEIRNCAVKTLTGTLLAHSFRLSALAWNGCAERALLPLLEQVMQGGTASEEQAGAGRSRGDLQLLLHHSRDTPRKQWNETRVLALGGVAKVLRTAMPRLAVLQDGSGRPLFVMLTDGGSNGLWRKMLRAAGVAAGSRDGEVGIAGVGALLELLKAAGFVVGEGEGKEEADEEVKMGMSSSAPAALGMGARAGDEEEWRGDVKGEAEEKMRGEKEREREESAVALWEAVWSAVAEAIGRTGKGEACGMKIVDDKALEMLAEGLLEARVELGKKFRSRSSGMFVEVLLELARGRDEGELSGVQEVTLRGLEGVDFGSDESSWVGLVRGLVQIIEEELDGGRAEGLLVRRVLGILGEVYSGEKVGKRVKGGEVRGVLRVVGRIMILRNEGRSGAGGRGLWMEGAEVMMKVMKCGMGGGCEGADTVWGEFVEVMEEFLYSGRGNGEGEDYDIKLTECVQEALTGVGREGGGEISGRLVRLLAVGAEEGKGSGRPRFVRCCQRRLFYLAAGGSGGGMGGRIAETATRCVVETCGRVLGLFISDGQRAGRCPLPAARRAEAVFLLQQLKILEGRGGGDLGELYPRLCECVESRDEAVRGLARDLLDGTAGRVGAGKGTLRGLGMGARGGLGMGVGG